MTTGKFTFIWSSFLFWDVTFASRSVNDVKVEQQPLWTYHWRKKNEKEQYQYYPYCLSGSEARLSAASSLPTNLCQHPVGTTESLLSCQRATKKPIPLLCKDIKLDLCITSPSRMRISCHGYLSFRDDDGAMKVINVRGWVWASEWERHRENEWWNWE